MPTLPPEAGNPSQGPALPRTALISVCTYPLLPCCPLRPAALVLTPMPCPSRSLQVRQYVAREIGLVPRLPGEPRAAAAADGKAEKKGGDKKAAAAAAAAPPAVAGPGAKHSLLWVVDFPMFEFDPEEQR